MKDVRKLKRRWLRQFRDINKSDCIKRDLRYEEYYDELANFLNSCKCEQAIEKDEYMYNLIYTPPENKREST